MSASSGGLQSASLEYQHMQREKNGLLNWMKTIIFAAETTV